MFELVPVCLLPFHRCAALTYKLQTLTFLVSLFPDQTLPGFPAQLAKKFGLGMGLKNCSCDSTHVTIAYVPNSVADSGGGKGVQMHPPF